MPKNKDNIVKRIPQSFCVEGPALPLILQHLYATSLPRLQHSLPEPAIYNVTITPL